MRAKKVRLTVAQQAEIRLFLYSTTLQIDGQSGGEDRRNLTYKTLTVAIKHWEILRRDSLRCRVEAEPVRKWGVFQVLCSCEPPEWCRQGRFGDHLSVRLFHFITIATCVILSKHAHQTQQQGCSILHSIYSWYRAEAGGLVKPFRSVG